MNPQRIIHGAAAGIAAVCAVHFVIAGWVGHPAEQTVPVLTSLVMAGIAGALWRM